MLISTFSEYKRFLKFSIVGVSNTLIDYGMFAFLVQLNHVDMVIANVISFITALLNSYFLNKRWTFSNPNKTTFPIKRVLVFLLGNVVYLTLSTLIIFWTSKILPAIYAKGIAILVCFPVNYLFSKKSFSEFRRYL